MKKYSWNFREDDKADAELVLDQVNEDACKFCGEIGGG